MDFMLRVSANDSKHILNIILLRRQQIIIIFVILLRHLACPLPGRINAMLPQLPHRRRIDRIADFLPARRSRCDFKLIRYAAFCNHVPEDELGHRGTADIAVAEEAAQTAEYFGTKVTRVYDVGVSGIHRLLRNLEAIQSANCVVAVAGMEGALASVLGGLVDKPVIAVPTSVGYGANLGGLSALLTMINSCANGIAVVNIDNGYGAGYMATQINRLGVKANG